MTEIQCFKSNKELLYEINYPFVITVWPLKYSQYIVSEAITRIDSQLFADGWMVNE